MGSQNEDDMKKMFEDGALKAGIRLSSPSPGDDVVITGMAGKFPESDDVYQLRDNLFNKADMVTYDYRRWKPTHPEIPQRMGKLNNIEKFDAGFFGVSQLQADFTDPLARLSLERAFEAIVDAGYHPSELAGSNTGVFTSNAFSEAEQYSLHENQTSQTDSITGCMRSMIANRLSYFFKLKGPSYNADTACSSSMFAFEQAYRAIRNGECDKALVGSAHLCLLKQVTLQFSRLGVLSSDGYCRSFDDNADGYVRSEGICVVLLEKSKDARRIYAHVVHAKTNNDGYKKNGITFPSSEMQTLLLREFYNECRVDPAILTYLEAHATGTKAGDPVELNTIDQVFCTGRDTPLYLGAIKSNIGHNEPASCLCSVIKVLIGMETGFIPPNINFEKNKSGVDALEKERVKVITEKMAMPKNEALVGVNCFGFGGSNGHILLRRYEKVKMKDTPLNDDLPRLICVSGRTPTAVKVILEDMKNRQMDVEYVKLLHAVFRKDITGHLCRGYSIVGQGGEIARGLSADATKKKICFIFTGFDRNWYKIGHQMMPVTLFAETFKQIQKVLSHELDFDVSNIISDSQENDLLKHVLDTVTIQVTLVKILKELGVEPDFFIGIATGDLIAAYFEDYLTLKEVVLATVYIELCVSKQQDSSDCVKTLKNFLPNRDAIFKTWLPLKTHNKLVGFKGQCSADYFLKSALSPITFNLAKMALPDDSLMVLIGPRVKNDNNVNDIDLIKFDVEDHFISFLNGLGCLYNNGCNLELDKLYPKIKWPVSRGTPMLSPLIKWIHDKDYYVSCCTGHVETTMAHRVYEINAHFDDWSYITGHVIDGRNLFPATGYLYLAWEVLSTLVEDLMHGMRVCFEDVKFVRASHIPANGVLLLDVMVQLDSGKFEITEGNATIVHGNIHQIDDDDEMVVLPEPSECLSNLKMNERDIYKELKLRGYNYTGLFRGIKTYDVETTKGTIEWSNNWVSFMDCMLQMQILKLDTRSLFIPTSIKKIIIDAPKHLKYTTDFTDNNLPIYYSDEAKTISCGYVEISDLMASSIPRRKCADPVLESYRFVPNNGEFAVEHSLRIMMQIILENTNATVVKCLEIEDDSHPQLLSPLVLEALNDTPLVQPEVIIFSKKNLDLPGVTVKNEDLGIENDNILLVVADVFGRDKNLDELLDTVKGRNGYVISRESATFDATQIEDNRIQVLCVHDNQTEKLILMRATKEKSHRIIVDVTEEVENWMPNLQKALNDNQDVIILSQNQIKSGILGLVNCLRREPNGDKVSCVFIMEEAPDFDLHKQFYKKQLSKNLAINVWKNSNWGTYRHLLIEKMKQVESEHCYCNVTVRGDLSSLTWIESSLTRNSAIAPEKSLVHIYYASLNFRDLMTASGRIAADAITTDRIAQDCLQGFEFVGRDILGNRVMGMAISGALATMVEADLHLLMPVPDEWSMAEAATVPVVYGTVVYAFFIRAQMKSGQSVLIHSGTGGVGQAAINIALHYGCIVFTTVGTQEKRDFIKRNFPQIKDSHIGNSRDTSFEQMIYKQTGGRGVDIVLNSLAEEKLQASVRCLAQGGKFLEIGKFDMASDNNLHMQMFSKRTSFEGVMLDVLMANTPDNKKQIISELMRCIEDGAVKPLPKTVFKDDELEEAFRFMSTGKHIGKVLVQIREEEEEKHCLVPRRTFKGIPRFYCDPDGVYVIVGGLGGFGLELADWLVIRGAKKLVLTSRHGIKNGYQLLRLKIWQSYGTKVLIRTDDTSNEDGCTELLNAATRLGTVKAIFNLAVILKDDVFNNLNADDYEISFKPKAYATKHLDVMSRKICPLLEHFVVFSSISCGIGNAGQTNYGMSNSIMERICEQRKVDGYSALAIQWGAIGDVGLVAEMQYDSKELAIGGILQQKIANCLQVLDTFLRQNEPIVASMVVAEKRTRSSGTSSIVEAVLNILGVSELKAVSFHSTFPELGMDSLMAVEIKQTLEREYEVFLSPQDIRSMTITKLQEMATGNVESVQSNRGMFDELPVDAVLLLRHIGNENVSNIPVVNLNSMSKIGSTVYMLSGLEGVALTLQPLAEKLYGPVSCLQFCTEYNSESIDSLAKSVFNHMNVVGDFKLVAYSFGCVVANELIRSLEKEGRRGKVVFIDGSIDMVSQLVKTHLKVDSEEEFQIGILCSIMSRYMPVEKILEHKMEILNYKTYEERIDYIISVSPDSNSSAKYLKEIYQATHARLKAVNTYTPNGGKFRSKMMLIKPTTQTIADVSEDYGLSKWFDGVNVKTFEGDHSTVLENSKVAEEINKFFEE